MTWREQDARDQVYRRIRESVEHRHALVPGSRFPIRHRLRHIYFERWIMPGWIDLMTAQVLCEIVPEEILERVEVVVGAGKVGPDLAAQIAAFREIHAVKYNHPLYNVAMKDKSCLIVDAARRTGVTLMDTIEIVKLYGGHPVACVVLVDCARPILLPLLNSPLFSFTKVDMPSYVPENCPICRQIQTVKNLKKASIQQGVTQKF